MHIEMFESATAFSTYIEVLSGSKTASFATVMRHFYPSSNQETSSAMTNRLDLSSPSNDISTYVPSANAEPGHSSAGTKLMDESNTAQRRRRPSVNDHIKHRRTRNGCYTCRGRRVKVEYLFEWSGAQHR